MRRNVFGRHRRCRRRRSSGTGNRRRLGRGTGHRNSGPGRADSARCRAAGNGPGTEPATRGRRARAPFRSPVHPLHTLSRPGDYQGRARTVLPPRSQIRPRAAAGPNPRTRPAGRRWGPASPGVGGAPGLDPRGPLACARADSTACAGPLGAAHWRRRAPCLTLTGYDLPGIQC